MTPFQRLLKVNIDFIEASLEYMPDCAYRDYCRWILATGGSNLEDWLQLVGMMGLMRLSIGLLDGIVEADEWEPIARYTAIINIQQMYEVVSDNLAIGLAHPADDDTNNTMRRTLLRSFNHAMIERLNGSPRPGQKLLTPLKPTMDLISTFQQSLSPAKHEALTGAFLNHRTDLTRSDLEYTLWPTLIANIETTFDLAKEVRDRRVSNLTTQGLISRYAGVNSLLDESQMPITRRMHVSAGTIMVIPTLAYYVGVLTEIIRPLEGLNTIVDSGLLYDALYDAALLVRMLNDMGTRLLIQSDDERIVLFDKLKAKAAGSNARTLDALLLESLDEFAQLFTRIRKDVLHREFNLCLYDYTSPVMNSLGLFQREVAYVSQQYAQTQARLSRNLNTISESLKDQAVSEMIGRFVKFHEVLYMHAYDEPLGEYAV